MAYPEVAILKDRALELDEFKEMDYYAVNSCHLPIELMMENAGLQLANLTGHFAKKDQIIKIGIGNGNNGGGGLVAARRLAAWGYSVYLDIFTELTKELVRSQLERALAFGAKLENIQYPDVWIDAYLGFSQHLPLNNSLLNKLEEANNSQALKLSLDLPTGFLGNTDVPFFKSAKILTLAAPKKILYSLDKNVEIFIADIGIPKEAYLKFGIENLPFQNNNIVKLLR
jgi:hydroxyethylthiazole kinase-like uncharacterized protein yjeF